MFPFNAGLSTRGRRSFPVFAGWPPFLRRVAPELRGSPEVVGAKLASLLGLLTLLHVVLNWTGIGNEEFWIDEASTYALSVYPLERVVTITIDYHSQPPLFYILVNLVARLSATEAALRAIPWTCCLLFVYYAVLALPELKLVSRVVLAVMFIAHGHTFFMAQEMRPYALSVLTTFVASVQMVRLLEQPKSESRFWWYVISALLMAYSLAFTAWMLVAHGIFGACVIVQRMIREGVWPTLVEHKLVFGALACVAGLYLPYVIAVTKAQARTMTESVTLAARWDVATESKHHLKALSKMVLLKEPMSYVVYAIATYVAVRRLRRGDLLPILLVLMLFGHIAFVHGFLHGKLHPSAIDVGGVAKHIRVSHRYYTPAYGVFLWWLAIAFDEFVGRRNRTAMRASIFVIVALLAIEGPDAVAQWREPALVRNWRRLFDETRVIPGTKGFFFDTGFYGQMLEHQARDDRSYYFFLRGYEPIPGTMMAGGGSNMTPGYINQMVDRYVGEVRCFFYVSNKRKGHPNLYEPAFVPTMARIGYQKKYSFETRGKIKTPYHNWYRADGYCRP